MNKTTIHKVVRRGAEHSDFCEDFLSTYESEDFIIGAIFDGCSGGIHSHFASALMGKVFNNVTKQYLGGIESSLTPKGVANFILFEFAQKLFQTQTYLKMSDLELQSTVVLMVYEKQSSDAFVIAVGDGFISVDGKNITIENTRYSDEERGDKLVLGENRPDYIIGDLKDIQTPELFNAWFEGKKDSYFFKDVTDITITSDGIDTFSKVKTPKKDEDIDIIDFLVKDTWLQELSVKTGDQTLMMKRKLNLLNNVYGKAHKDDLSIIRIAVEKVNNQVSITQN